jgi:para-aminobenzoate synthetase component 1
VVPFVEEIVPPPDPAGCCEKLAGLPYRLFLDSASKGLLGRYSFLTADPIAIVWSKGSRIEILDRISGIRRDGAGDALDAVRGLLAPHAAAAVPGLPPFQGGAAGYLAYDWGRVLERLPAPRHDDLGLPDVVLGVYDWVLAWDHEMSRAWLISTGLPEAAPARRMQRAAARARTVRERLDRPADPNGHGCHPTGSAAPSISAGPPPTPAAGRAVLDPAGSTRQSTGPAAPSYVVDGGSWSERLGLRSSFTHDGYLEAVARVREYIFAGDIFQANMSQRFEAPLAESPWALYRRLRARNAAPFGAYLDFPEVVVLSASPERFLRVAVTGQVETRPIKGTRPRGVGPEHDAALGQALVESGKDRAENLMIVDLMRNDLSRVCLPGTVRVSELFALEHYATVHHLVSTVVGTLAPGLTALDVLRGAFPGGSITGAPKLRAMEVIAELEPSQRGVYCGAIGYWSLTGALDTNIAIRTAVALGDRVYFSAGGGIVADSDPELEYRETLDKALGLIDALATPA